MNTPNGAIELTLGPKIAEGREAEVYAWGGGAVVAVAW